MNIQVQGARTKWRETLDAVDEIVDRFVARTPVQEADWVALEECEHAARQAYYALLREKYGLPTPRGLGD